MEYPDYLNLYNYVVDLYFIDPKIDFYDYHDFRLRSDTDFETIINRFFSGIEDLKYTFFEDASAVCIHKGIRYINSRIINYFVYRGIKIEGEGVILGIRDKKIIRNPSEIPLHPMRRFDKKVKNPENIIVMKYNNFKSSYIDWSKAGDEEIRRMDKESDGFWRIANDLD